MKAYLTQKGFTLVELISVLILIGIISSVAVTSLIPSTSIQLQSSRDNIVAAFFSAQQKAMAQTTAVRLTTGTNIIDIKMDINNDGVFSAGESVSLGGVQYPISLLSSQTLTVADFDFDRLGRTSGGSVVLSQAGSTVTIAISANGSVN